MMFEAIALLRVRYASPVIEIVTLRSTSFCINKEKNMHPLSSRGGGGGFTNAETIPFLSDLNCSHSKIKFAAKIKLIVAWHFTIVIAEWLLLQPLTQIFVCRSRAICPKLFGLCLIIALKLIISIASSLFRLVSTMFIQSTREISSSLPSVWALK